MKPTLLITFALSLLNAVPAFAQSSYVTPEYSGPSARIEHGMNRNGSPKPVQSERGAVYYNDGAFEAEAAARHEHITREMDMRREETIRANQRYILKTNE